MGQLKGRDSQQLGKSNVPVVPTYRTTHLSLCLTIHLKGYEVVQVDLPGLPTPKYTIGITLQIPF
jgi:hypothetical protein